MKIAVIDGEGGAIGTAIIRKIRQLLGQQVELWALGTNAIATGQMLKAGANRGATGENAIICCAPQVDLIVGPISILITNAFLGEITGNIVQAVGSADALKLILPISQEPVRVVSAFPEPLPNMLDGLVNLHIAPLLGGAKKVYCVT